MSFEGVGATVPAPGDVLGGKYLIQRLLGEGGMAVVFEATHQRLNQRVALKLLHPNLARDNEIVARFEREARALALLKSRHVARVIDVEMPVARAHEAFDEFGNLRADAHHEQIDDVLEALGAAVVASRELAAVA